MAGDPVMLLRMGGLGNSRRGGRAGDVRDRRDVIPVDPVPDSQEEAGDEHAETDGRCGGDGEQRLDHVILMVCRTSLGDGSRCCNMWQLQASASVVVSFARCRPMVHLMTKSWRTGP